MPADTKRANDLTRPLKPLPPMPSQTAAEILTSPVVQLSNASALLDAVAAISTPLQIRAVAEEAARQIVMFSNADICTISHWNPEQNEITLWAEYHRGSPSATPVAYLPYKASEYPTTEQVLRTLHPKQILFSDPRLDKGERTNMEGMGAQSLLILPLVARNQTIGLIELFETKHEREFTPDELASIQVLAKHAGISLERAKLLEETEKNAAELEIIRQASLNLTSSLENEKVLPAILESALRLSPNALDAHIFTYVDGDLIYGGSLWASNQKAGPAWKKVRPGGLTESVAKSGEVIAVENVRKHPLYKDSEWVKNGWNGSIIGMPLKIGPRVVGVMNIAYKLRQDFNQERLYMLGLLADQAAVAILNAQLHDMVKRQAITDPLTGLANRRAFNDRLEEEIRRSDRYNHEFCLVMIDLDGFKRINDTFGHPTGDRVLINAARCLSAVIRDTDFLARYGGDEFALILPETVPAHTQLMTKKISGAMQRCQLPWSETESTLRLSLTAGTASYPQDALIAEELIAVADAALYENKKK